MALRNQPYFPLYVQDFLTDEKLNECSACATGIYIKIMCLMHKSNEYGMILLQQKDKQKDNQIENFALKMLRHLPFTFDEIFSGLNELVEQKVLLIDGDIICQKRMVKDNEVSNKRSKAGKKGGEKSSFVSAKGQAKGQANPEYESEDQLPFKEYDYFILNKNTQFKESVFRNKILAKRIPISYEKYEKMLLEFCQAEQDNGREPESEPDYRSHFQNWLVIQSEKKDSWDQEAKSKLPPEKGYER